MQNTTIRSVSLPGKNKRNEDFLRYATLNSGEIVAVLGDGMGGLSFGDLAAQIVVNTMFNTVIDSIERQKDYNIDAIFLKAFEKADSKIMELCYEKHCKMGAAVTALIIARETLYFTWQGNVRLYRTTTNGFELLTNDHILPLASEQSNFLTRCVNGKGFRQPPEIQKISLLRPEKLYLCTDGCYRLLESGQKSFNMEKLTDWNDFEDDYSIMEIFLHSAQKEY